MTHAVWPVVCSISAAEKSSPVKGVVGITGAGEEGVNQLVQLPRLENT